MKTQTIATFVVPDGLSERVERYAVTACGGATVSGLQGGAWDSGDRLIREPVRTVTVFGPLGALWALAYSVALRLEHAGEDAVAFTLDGSAYVETLGAALRLDILRAVRALEGPALWEWCRTVSALGEERDASADFKRLDLERPEPRLFGEHPDAWRARCARDGLRPETDEECAIRLGDILPEDAQTQRAALGVDEGSGAPGRVETYAEERARARALRDSEDTRYGDGEVKP